MIKKKEYSRTKNSYLNIISGIGGQLVLTVLSFISRTIFIHVLGVEYLGIGGLFSNILSLLSLTQLGLDTAINFKLYKPLADNDEKRIRVLMKFYKQCYRIIGCVILILGLLLIPVLPWLIKDYGKLAELGISAPFIFLLYLMQSVSSYWFFAYRTTIVKTAQKMYLLNIVDIFVDLARILSQIAVLIIFHDFIVYVSLVIFFTFFRNGINAVIAQKMFPTAFISEKESISKEERNGIFKDCGALFTFRISRVVLKSTDNLVISSIIGLAAVGLYSNYLLFYATIHNFLDQIYRSVKASMGNLYAKEGLGKNYFIFEVMNFVTIILNGIACIGIAICANEIITLWLGERYIIPQPFPILLGIEILFNGLKVNLLQVRNISGAFRQVWKRPILGCIINLAVSIILCKYIGIIGVVIGTITADVLTNFMVDPRIIHKYSFKNYKPVSYYYKKNCLFLLILALIYIFDFYICKSVKMSNDYIALVVHITIIVVTVPVVYIGLYWKSPVCQYLVKKINFVSLIKRRR